MIRFPWKFVEYFSVTSLFLAIMPRGWCQFYKSPIYSYMSRVLKTFKKKNNRTLDIDPYVSYSFLRLTSIQDEEDPKKLLDAEINKISLVKKMLLHYAKCWMQNNKWQKLNLDTGCFRIYGRQHTMGSSSKMRYTS